ncbi:MAG: lactate utilization protein [Geminicoccaceae bacterium]|nr:MAG: lactate utilization protein [Geminicoccaceae bacterium]
MTVAYTSQHFKQEAKAALVEPNLQRALDRTTTLLQGRRAEAYRAYAEFETTRDAGSAIKDHVLCHLDHYLEAFERNAVAAGCQVHWAATAEEACRIVVDLCQQANAKTVTRVKSMLGEEIGLPEALDEAGFDRVETDLAEHINQLAGDRPSHIVIPALHKTQEQVAELFAQHHGHGRVIEEVGELVQSARLVLREKYFAADVGISGANFLVADTGAVCTVTNEGNAELTMQLPRVQIVTAGIEKLVPSLDHAGVLLRLLARSALGMEITQYTTFLTGARRPGDRDGPEAMHIVLVDAGRTDILADEIRSILKCIRCAACINHCPVYSQIGGHAYGGIYQGPMGSVLTPAMASLAQAKDLPHACTLNGRCVEVCPVKIPLTDLMRTLRERTWREQLVDRPTRFGLGLWAAVAKRPALYRFTTRWAIRALKLWSRGRGAIRFLPFAGAFTASRDLPAPEGGTFMDRYRRGER